MGIGLTDALDLTKSPAFSIPCPPHWQSICTGRGREPCLRAGLVDHVGSRRSISPQNHQIAKSPGHVQWPRVAHLYRSVGNHGGPSRKLSRESDARSEDLRALSDSACASKPGTVLTSELHHPHFGKWSNTVSHLQNVRTRCERREWRPSLVHKHEALSGFHLRASTLD